jgi:hypothetical protein
MSGRRNFQCYVNLHTTEPKLRALLKDFRCVPLAKILRDRSLLAAA